MHGGWRVCGRVEWSGGNLVCWWVKAVKAVKPVPSSHHTPSANRTYTELIAAYVIQFLRLLAPANNNTLL